MLPAFARQHLIYSQSKGLIVNILHPFGVHLYLAVIQNRIFRCPKFGLWQGQFKRTGICAGIYFLIQFPGNQLCGCLSICYNYRNISIQGLGGCVIDGYGDLNIFPSCRKDIFHKYVFNIHPVICHNLHIAQG